MKIFSISRSFVYVCSFALLFLLSGCQGLQPFAGEPRRLRISVVGDVMCHSPQLAAAWNADTKTYDFNGVFEPVRAELSAADLTIANLETTLPGDRTKFAGYPAFGSPDALAEALKGAGVDILTLANNHTVDKGKAGMLRTVEVVEKLGFQHLGSYRTLDEWNKNRVLIVEQNEIKLALLNYTYGTNGIPVPGGTRVNLIGDGQQMKADLKLAREMGPDGIVVLLHYGGEYLREPDAYQKKWTAFALQHGADIVIGGHPHVLQPFGVQTVTDVYGQTKERLVAYSLGNFVSNQQRRYTDGGMIFHFTLEKNPDDDAMQKLLFRDIDYTPVWVYRDRIEGKLTYRVLPAEEYLDREGPHAKLSDWHITRLKTFYTDTTTHLRPSLQAVEQYRSEGAEKEDEAEAENDSTQSEAIPAN